MGANAGTIVASMLRTMTAAIDDIEAAFAVGDLDRATQAAHLWRDDALMLGAKPLLEALTALKAATTDHDESRARGARPGLSRRPPRSRSSPALQR
jgi:hypothetical protein